MTQGINSLALLRNLLGVAMGLGLLTTTAASALTISGTMSGTPTGNGYADVGTISGSFSLFFDTSVVTGAAYETFRSLPLTSFSMSPNPMGATTFDLTNSAGFLVFENGELTIVAIGGTTSGAEAISSGTDFQFVYYGSPVGSGLSLSARKATDSGIGSAPAPTGSLTVVPEPTTALLLATGLTALAARRRH